MEPTTWGPDAPGEEATIGDITRPTVQYKEYVSSIFSTVFGRRQQRCGLSLSVLQQLWLPSGWHAGLRRRRARVQIAAATLSGNSLRQTVHTHRASVHQAAKLVAALLRETAEITAGRVAVSNGSLPPGL